MNAMPMAATLTLEEFLALPDVPGLRFELLDGELITMNGPIARHQIVALRIAASLLGWCDAGRSRGRVLHEFAALFGSDTVLFPDIQWFADGHAPRDDEHLHAVADIAIEVASPSTARYDANVKRARYLAGGASEVWLVDAQRLTVQVWRGPELTQLGPDAALSSPLLPGFTLPLAGLAD